MGPASGPLFRAAELFLGGLGRAVTGAEDEVQHGRGDSGRPPRTGCRGATDRARKRFARLPTAESVHGFVFPDQEIPDAVDQAAHEGFVPARIAAARSLVSSVAVTSASTPAIVFGSSRCTAG